MAGTYTTSSVTTREVFSGTIVAKAQPASATFGAQTASKPNPPLVLKLISNGKVIVPKSLMFTFGGFTYVERSGTIYKSVSSVTNAGTAVGTIDYDSGTVVLTDYPGGAAETLSLISCLTNDTGYSTNQVVFRTSGAPLRPGSLQVTAVRADTGATVTASANTSGVIDTGIIKGYVDYTSGLVKLRFTTNLSDLSGASEVPVVPSLLTYNAVVQSLLPLDADLLGLNPVRLPTDGRVPVYRAGDITVLHNTQSIEVVSPVAGGTLNLTRTDLAFVEVVGANGKILATDKYAVNMVTGILTWGSPLVLTDASSAAVTTPLTVKHRVEHMALVTDVQITGEVSLSSPLPWDAATAGTFLSSAVAWGDLQATITNWFTQQTWNSSAPNWTNVVSGGTTTSQYNRLAYPPSITNVGAVEGKWAIVFTSSTGFNVVEQNLGVIATGTTSLDCSPINPMTGQPYFTIRKEGWGSGWAAGNAVRFNTTACLGPMWTIRTVLSGNGTVASDAFKLQVRGDAD